MERCVERVKEELKWKKVCKSTIHYYTKQLHV